MPASIDLRGTKGTTYRSHSWQLFVAASTPYGIWRLLLEHKASVDLLAERPWDDRSNDRPDGGRSQASKQGRKGHTECVHAEAASGGRQQKNTKPPSLRVVTLDVFLFVSFSLFAAT